MRSRRFADELRRGAHADALQVVDAGATREYGGDIASALRGALERLPDGQREVVVLKLLRGARFAEIGAALGISPDAAKMRFVRAVEALRTDLEEQGVER